MQKDFDKWNEHKKQINSLEIRKFYRQRELWWCSLGSNIGFEQDGTGNNGERPVLILRGFSPSVCLIIPLTTSKKHNPYHITLGLVADREAVAIISQIRLIDTKRLVNRIGYLNQALFLSIRKTIKGLL